MRNRYLRKLYVMAAGETGRNVALEIYAVCHEAKHRL